MKIIHSFSTAQRLEHQIKTSNDKLREMEHQVSFNTKIIRINFMNVFTEPGKFDQRRRVREKGQEAE